MSFSNKSIPSNSASKQKPVGRKIEKKKSYAGLVEQHLKRHAASFLQSHPT
jgi:hypothetical protein